MPRLSDTETDVDLVEVIESVMPRLSDTEMDLAVSVVTESVMPRLSDTETDVDLVSVTESVMPRLSDTETDVDLVSVTESVIPNLSVSRFFDRDAPAASAISITSVDDFEPPPPSLISKVVEPVPGPAIYATSPSLVVNE